MVGTPPLRGGVSWLDVISRPIAPTFGTVGHVVSTAYRYNHTLIAADGDHALLITLSYGHRTATKTHLCAFTGPLMYTVLSVVCPITVVRVLIFRSAEATVEKDAGAASEYHDRRFTGSTSSPIESATLVKRNDLWSQF